MPTVAHISERTVNQATPMVIARYTPQGAGLFSAMLYLRVMQPVGVLFSMLEWSDGGGPQQMVLTGGAYEPGSYTVRPVTVQAVTSQDLVLSIETDVVNAVAASVVFKSQ